MNAQFSYISLSPNLTGSDTTSHSAQSTSSASSTHSPVSTQSSRLVDTSHVAQQNSHAPYSDPPIKWLKRRFLNDGRIQYFFSTVEKAVAFTVAMNTKYNERAGMIWSMEGQHPRLVSARFIDRS
jgi:hypothetical protein